MSTPSGGASIGTLALEPSAFLPHVTIGTHMHARGGVKIAASRSASAALKKHSPPPRPRGRQPAHSPPPSLGAATTLLLPPTGNHSCPVRRARSRASRSRRARRICLPGASPASTRRERPPQALGAFGAKVEVMASDLALRSRRSAAARATASCFSCTSGLRAAPQLSALGEGGQRRQRAAAPQCVVLLVHLCEAAFQPPALLVLLSHSAARDAGESAPGPALARALGRGRREPLSTYEHARRLGRVRDSAVSFRLLCNHGLQDNSVARESAAATRGRCGQENARARGLLWRRSPAAQSASPRDLSGTRSHRIPPPCWSVSSTQTGCTGQKDSRGVSQPSPCQNCARRAYQRSATPRIMQVGYGPRARDAVHTPRRTLRMIVLRRSCPASSCVPVAPRKGAVSRVVTPRRASQLANFASRGRAPRPTLPHASGQQDVYCKR